MKEYFVSTIEREGYFFVFVLLFSIVSAAVLSTTRKANAVNKTIEVNTL